MAVNGPKVLELDDEEDDEAATASAAAAAGGGEDGTRAQNLNRMVSLLNQRQLETCLKFRSFAARNLVSRARLLKAVHARLDLWRACSPGYERRLCGGLPEARAKVRTIYARLLLERADRACEEWAAARVERQLVGDADREEAARQNKAANRRRKERLKQHRKTAGNWSILKQHRKNPRSKPCLQKSKSPEE